MIWIQISETMDLSSKFCETFTSPGTLDVGQHEVLFRGWKIETPWISVRALVKVHFRKTLPTLINASNNFQN